VNISELLHHLKPQISFLSKSGIRGMESADIAQELYMMILNDVEKNPIFLADTYAEGWWFKRLKWYLLNLKEKEHREPVNKSIRFESFYRN